LGKPTYPTKQQGVKLISLVNFMAYKVLHLCSSLGIFGGETILLSLAQEGPVLGFKPIIGVLRNSKNPHTEIAERAHEKGIENVIFPCEGRLDIRSIREIRKFLLEQKVDIIHSHDYKSDFYALLASYWLKVHRLATCHNWNTFNQKLKWYSRIDKYLLRFFDSIIAVSPLVKEELVKYGIKQNKIQIINNGVNLNEYESQAWVDKNLLRNQLGVPKECTIVGCVGRLSPEKGFENFIRAAKIVVHEYPKTCFLIIGEGPEKENLHGLSLSLGIAENTFFAGLRKDVATLYKIMDVFVITSLYEGLPMVLLEAMASKKPIVSTRVGAIPQLIEDKFNGLLVDPGNVVELADSIKFLISDKEQAQLFSERGYGKVFKEFSSRIMAENYEKSYQQLLKSNPGSN